MQQFAERVELTASRISNFERGQAQPTVAVLQRLAGALGVPVDYLLGGPFGGAPAVYLEDRSLFQLFQSIEELPEKEQESARTLIEEFLKTRTN